MSKKVDRTGQIFVGDNDHDPENSGWVDAITGKKQKKPKVGTFKSVAKRIKKQKENPPKQVNEVAQAQRDWFDKHFEETKDSEYWGMGYYGD